MNASTQFPFFWDAAHNGTRMPAFQGQLAKLLYPASPGNPTVTDEPDSSMGARLTPDALQTKVPNRTRAFTVPPPLAMGEHTVALDSSVIQLWEGRVTDVRRQDGVMDVLLNAKIGNVPPHTGEIELQWVHDQDRELVRPGAIFYLTLYKRTKRGSIENAQELRFRRLPSWTRQQVEQIEIDAQMLLSKMKARPIAE